MLSHQSLFFRKLDTTPDSNKQFSHISLIHLAVNRFIPPPRVPCCAITKAALPRDFDSYGANFVGFKTMCSLKLLCL